MFMLGDLIDWAAGVPEKERRAKEAMAKAEEARLERERLEAELKDIRRDIEFAIVRTEEFQQLAARQQESLAKLAALEAAQAEQRRQVIVPMTAIGGFVLLVALATGRRRRRAR